MPCGVCGGRGWDGRGSLVGMGYVGAVETYRRLLRDAQEERVESGFLHDHGIEGFVVVNCGVCVWSGVCGCVRVWCQSRWKERNVGR